MEVHKRFNVESLFRLSPFENTFAVAVNGVNKLKLTAHLSEDYPTQEYFVNIIVENSQADNKWQLFPL
ncbi:hypothetical protein EGI32_08870 [Ferruginibacter sp. HRS2-29]|nr:hypothetical protein [Ferruginibacter sp. HRS2-29]